MTSNTPTAFINAYQNVARNVCREHVGPKNHDGNNATFMAPVLFGDDGLRKGQALQK